MAMLSRVVFIGFSFVIGCTDSHAPGATRADAEEWSADSSAHATAASTMADANAAGTTADADAAAAIADAAATMADAGTTCGEALVPMLDLDGRCVGQGVLVTCAQEWDGSYQACGEAITYGRDRHGRVFVFGNTCLPESVQYVPTRTGTPEAEWGTWPNCERR